MNQKKEYLPNIRISKKPKEVEEQALNLDLNYELLPETKGALQKKVNFSNAEPSCFQKSAN